MINEIYTLYCSIYPVAFILWHSYYISKNVESSFSEPPESFFLIDLLKTFKMKRDNPLGNLYLDHTILYCPHILGQETKSVLSRDTEVGGRAKSDGKWFCKIKRKGVPWGKRRAQDRKYANFVSLLAKPALVVCFQDRSKNNYPRVATLLTTF